MILTPVAKPLAGSGSAAAAFEFRDRPGTAKTAVRQRQIVVG
jgi:hypothetical protein